MTLSFECFLCLLFIHIYCSWDLVILIVGDTFSLVSSEATLSTYYTLVYSTKFLDRFQVLETVTLTQKVTVLFNIQSQTLRLLLKHWTEKMLVMMEERAAAAAAMTLSERYLVFINKSEFNCCFFIVSVFFVFTSFNLLSKLKDSEAANLTLIWNFNFYGN